jgi:hypothetical protein
MKLPVLIVLKCARLADFSAIAGCWEEILPGVGKGAGKTVAKRKRKKARMGRIEKPERPPRTKNPSCG